MSRLVALALFGALWVPQARLHAQITATAPQAETPQYQERWDLYGGAQYAHFNPSPGNQVKAINLLGWTGGATLWFRPVFGIEASARGVYGNIILPPYAAPFNIKPNPPMSEHFFLFGPSLRMIRRPRVSAGMHLLIGAAYGSFSSGFPTGITPQMVGLYNDKLAFGTAIGAYADYNVTPRWSVRFVPDWQPTHYGFQWQNEFAGSVGIVYKIGSLHSR